jgi:hypothetical protein
MSLDDLLRQRKALGNTISDREKQKDEIAKVLTADEAKRDQLEKDFMVYLQEFDAISRNKKTITNDEFFKKFNINVKRE